MILSNASTPLSSAAPAVSRIKPLVPCKFVDRGEMHRLANKEEAENELQRDQPSGHSRSSNLCT